MFIANDFWANFAIMALGVAIAALLWSLQTNFWRKKSITFTEGNDDAARHLTVDLACITVRPLWRISPPNLLHLEGDMVIRDKDLRPATRESLPYPELIEGAPMMYDFETYLHKRRRSYTITFDYRIVEDQRRLTVTFQRID